MRWICKDEIEECLSRAWRDTANQAKDSLLAASNATERKNILKQRASSDVWRNFYTLLPNSLKRKCWYCEAEDIRADMPIDHFRPKNKVEEDQNHDGYWWLAFDWDNYRCACTFCNSRRNFDETQGGKACKFPLKKPATRAYKPEDDELLEQECPDFLDPFDPDDEKLLWFDNDGLPEAKPDSNTEQVRKVENSIDIFHLNETRITRARNQIRLEVERHVRNLRENNREKEAKLALRRMVRDTEKLSRSAVVYLRAHRDLQAVKDILQLD
ncbi:retron system putative HNH endonuclease [Shewanella surugensis]|uniref:TIGR02646 family protein n=1 Tax=Shewanella surugensis TaxID=212020 RepID=A0ABT0LG41_9GAMM|nr:retron system putative HNH endonuclease [Shewanella surugensis]MCL1126327.1 TIGR02646 family protein [Shewanella surugensis]